jgi:chaperonin GroES
MLYPEGHKVLVRPDTTAETTSGGLHIPDSVQDSRQVAATRGEIIAIGPLAEVKFSEDLDGVTMREAKSGDRVMFAKFSGSSLMFNREQYRVIIDQDVIAFIDDDEKEEPESRISMVK